MTGFNSAKPHITIYKDEVNKLLKKYKKIKKYMKSPIFQVKKMDGTEEVVSELLKELETDTNTDL